MAAGGGERLGAAGAASGAPASHPKRTRVGVGHGAVDGHVEAGRQLLVRHSHRQLRGRQGEHRGEHRRYGGWRRRRNAGRAKPHDCASRRLRRSSLLLRRGLLSAAASWIRHGGSRRSLHPAPRPRPHLAALRQVCRHAVLVGGVRALQRHLQLVILAHRVHGEVLRGCRGEAQWGRVAQPSASQPAAAHRRRPNPSGLAAGAAIRGRP